MRKHQGLQRMTLAGDLNLKPTSSFGPSSSSRYPSISSPPTQKMQDSNCFQQEQMVYPPQQAHFRQQSRAQGMYHPPLRFTPKQQQPNPQQQQQQHASQYTRPVHNRYPSQGSSFVPRTDSIPRPGSQGSRRSVNDLEPYQSYLQYQQQAQNQHQNQQFQEYQQKNHPTNLNNYIIKVIVSPKEIRVLEHNGSMNNPLPKYETATISSTSSTSVLIYQLSDRLKASSVVSATGECPPRVENIAAYLRTAQYHLRNKAEPRFWPYFANASSSGSISCAYVERSQGGERPIVNSTNKTRVNPAQFWYEARKACESVDLAQDSIQVLLYLFVDELGTSGGVPVEILLIVHDGQINGKDLLEKKNNLNRSSVYASRNRASQNLEKVLQEYLETEKKLTSTSIFNGTVLSKSEFSTEEDLTTTDDLMLYDQSLNEFQAYMHMPPPVPEKDQGYLTSVLNKARKLRRSMSIKSTKSKVNDTISSEDSTSNGNSLQSDFDTNDTSPTNFMESSFSGEPLFTEGASMFSFQPGKGSFIANSKAKAVKHRISEHEAKAFRPRSKSLRLKKWLIQLFSINRPIDEDSQKVQRLGPPASSLSRTIQTYPSQYSRDSISDKYLLTNLDPIEFDMNDVRNSARQSRTSLSNFSDAGIPPQAHPYNHLLGQHDMRRASIFNPRSIPAPPSVPPRAMRRRSGFTVDTEISNYRPRTTGSTGAMSATSTKMSASMCRAYSNVYPAGGMMSASEQPLRFYNSEVARKSTVSHKSMPSPKIEKLSVIPLTFDSFNLEDW